VFDVFYASFTDILKGEVLHMAENVECSVEIGKDGVKTCSLHKEPLLEITALEQIPMGAAYPEIKEAWQCSVSGKSFMFPKF
jgi:hypothetical protein